MTTRMPRQDAMMKSMLHWTPTLLWHHKRPTMLRTCCLVCDREGAPHSVFYDVTAGGSGAPQQVSAHLRRRLEGVLAVTLSVKPGRPHRLCVTCEQGLCDIESRVRQFRDGYTNTTTKYAEKEKALMRDGRDGGRDLMWDTGSETTSRRAPLTQLTPHTQHVPHTPLSTTKGPTVLPSPQWDKGTRLGRHGHHQEALPPYRHHQVAEKSHGHDQVAAPPSQPPAHGPHQGAALPHRHHQLAAPPPPSQPAPPHQNHQVAAPHSADNQTRITTMLKAQSMSLGGSPTRRYPWGVEPQGAGGQDGARIDLELKLNAAPTNGVWTQKVMSSPQGLVVGSVLKSHGPEGTANIPQDRPLDIVPNGLHGHVQDTAQGRPQDRPHNRTLQCTPQDRQCYALLDGGQHKDEAQPNSKLHPNGSPQQRGRLKTSDRSQSNEIRQIHDGAQSPNRSQMQNELSPLALKPHSDALAMPSSRSPSAASSPEVLIMSAETSDIAAQRKAYGENPHYHPAIDDGSKTEAYAEETPPISSCNSQHPLMRADEQWANLYRHTLRMNTKPNAYVQELRPCAGQESGQGVCMVSRSRPQYAHTLVQTPAQDVSGESRNVYGGRDVENTSSGIDCAVLQQQGLDLASGDRTATGRRAHSDACAQRTNCTEQCSDQLAERPYIAGADYKSSHHAQHAKGCGCVLYKTHDESGGALENTPVGMLDLTQALQSDSGFVDMDESVLDLTTARRLQQHELALGSTHDQAPQACKHAIQQLQQVTPPAVARPRQQQYRSYYNQMAVSHALNQPSGKVISLCAPLHEKQCVTNFQGATEQHPCNGMQAGGQSHEAMTWGGKVAALHSPSGSRMATVKMRGPPPLIHVSEIKQEPIDSDDYGTTAVVPIFIRPVEDTTPTIPTSVAEKALYDEGFVDEPPHKRRKCQPRINDLPLQFGKLPVLNTHISATLNVANQADHEKPCLEHGDDASMAQMTTIQGTMRIPLNQLRESHKGPTNISMVTEATVHSGPLHTLGGNNQTPQCTTRIPVNMNLNQGAVTLKIPMSQSQELLTDGYPTYSGAGEARKVFNMADIAIYPGMVSDIGNLPKMAMVANGQQGQEGQVNEVMAEQAYIQHHQGKTRTEQYSWSEPQMGPLPIKVMYAGDGKPKLLQSEMQPTVTTGSKNNTSLCQPQHLHDSNISKGHPHQADSHPGLPQGHPQSLPQGLPQGHPQGLPHGHLRGHPQVQPKGQTGQVESTSQPHAGVPCADSDETDNPLQLPNDRENDAESDEENEEEDLDTATPDVIPTKNDLSGRRQLLRPWLEERLDRDNVTGFRWLNKEQNLFKIPWKHRSKNDWRPDNCTIFMEWAIHTGKYRPGIDELDYCRWKTRLRCAFNQAIDIRERKDLKQMKCGEPYKVYEFMPKSEIKVAKEMKQRANAARLPGAALSLMKPSVATTSVTSLNGMLGQGPSMPAVPVGGAVPDRTMGASMSKQTPPCTTTVAGTMQSMLPPHSSVLLGYFDDKCATPIRTATSPVMPTSTHKVACSQGTPNLKQSTPAKCAAPMASPLVENVSVMYTHAPSIPVEPNNNKLSWELEEDDDDEEDQPLVIDLERSELPVSQLHDSPAPPHCGNPTVPPHDSPAVPSCDNPAVPPSDKHAPPPSSHLREMLVNDVSTPRHACDSCGQSFLMLSALVKHQQTQHPMTPPLANVSGAVTVRSDMGRVCENGETGDLPVSAQPSKPVPGTLEILTDGFKKGCDAGAPAMMAISSVLNEQLSSADNAVLHTTQAGLISEPMPHLDAEVGLGNDSFSESAPATSPVTEPNMRHGPATNGWQVKQIKSNKLKLRIQKQ